MIEIDVDKLLLEKSVSKSGQGRDFEIALQKVCEKIELNAFASEDYQSARELSMIIAEVITLPPDVKIRVDGNDLPVYVVATIFNRLTHEHVNEVITRFRSLTYEVKNVKTYLRTALYNSVFELDNRISNEVAANQ